ncbi:hypothetical protein AVL56_02575 [Alteromonas stellipolaris]|uniref:hypothetical protein n=1 Tax=Alteromonas stellipolaris TaxID=233316 RepID=UPI00076FE42F|nr:hypothetical protein [Alteromonas stellipolaris]AMJ93296.1 hypothetical protein AVL56_02575 [Alteromonas stellipolaris]
MRGFAIVAHVFAPHIWKLYTQKELIIDTEFLVKARKQFQFLVNSYGFKEINSSGFELNYAKTTIQVRVEGINWGLNSRVAFGTTTDNFEDYDLFDIIPYYCCFKIKLKPNIGQLEQLPILSSLINAYARPVLCEDISSFIFAKAQQEKRAKQFRALI